MLVLYNRQLLNALRIISLYVQLKENPDLAEQIEAEVRANAFKLMSKQAQIAAKAAGRAVDVSADDFEDGSDE